MTNLTNDILNSAHSLIAGATGCGKSVLLHQVICDAISRPTAESELFLIDLKHGIELQEYEHLPHVARFAMDIPSALDALDQAIVIMEHRLDILRQEGRKQWEGRHVWVCIDEMGFLLQNARKQALPKIIHISQQGRAACVHLICCTQNPGRGRNGIPAEVQQNFTLKVALHCSTGIESRQVIGVSGAELLPKHGKVLVWEDGFVTKAEVSMITDEEKAAAIQASRSQQILHMKKA